MNKSASILITTCVAFLAAVSIAGESKQGDNSMTASGVFDVQVDPQKDDYAPVGRMVITKTYTGDLVGTGIGQMISKRTDNGVAVYSAIEEFDGKVDGKEGGFTLIHNGYMSSEGQSLEVKILKGSGSGELEDISGALEIVQTDDVHKYEFRYQL